MGGRINLDQSSIRSGVPPVLCLEFLAHASMALANILFNLFLVFLLLSGAVAGEVRITLRLLGQILLISLGVAIYWVAGDMTLSVLVFVIGITGAIAAAISYTALKKATKIASPWLINWSICAAAVPVSLLGASDSWSISTGLDWLLLGSIGTVSLLGQYLTIVSFARLPLALASSLAPSAIVWSVLLDTIAVGGHLSIQGLIGATIYTIGICLLAAFSSVPRKK